MATATVSSKGQITIPRPVRERLGLAPGDRVEFVELPSGQIALLPAVEDVRALKGMVPKPAKPLSVADMRVVVAKRAADGK